MVLLLRIHLHNVALTELTNFLLTRLNFCNDHINHFPGGN